MATRHPKSESAIQSPTQSDWDCKARANTDPLRSWSDASLRSWEMHRGERSAKELYRDELLKGTNIHSLVGVDEVRLAIQLHRRSLERLIRDVRARTSHEQPEIEPIKVLFAPTARVVDYNVRADVIQACIQRLCDAGQEAELLAGIEHGPANGREIWDNPSPETPVELVASIVRWAALGHGEKKRIRVSDSLRSWILDAAKTLGVEDLRPRLGGVSAVGALTSNALGHTATMMALGSIPTDVAARLPKRIQIVGDSAEAHTIGDLAVDTKAVGNVGILIPAGAWSLAELLPNATIRGKPIASHEIPTLDCLITGSSSVPGFGSLSSQRMQLLGTEHDLMILTGFQTLNAEKGMDDYFAHVIAARSAGIPTALLYSETKHPEIELCALRRLREIHTIEFLGINGVETFDLLKRINADSNGQNILSLSADLRRRLHRFATQEDLQHPTWINTKEFPENILEGAKLLQEILDIPLVRVRGRVIDVLIGAKRFEFGSTTPKPQTHRSELRDVIFNLSSSRLLGVLKVALSGGLIKEPTDVTQLFNLPEGNKLAALRILDDAITREYATSLSPDDSNYDASNRPLLAKDFVSRLPDGRMVAAVPPIDFHDKTGGTVSAGDTMDSCFLVESIELLRQAYRYNSKSIPSAHSDDDRVRL